MTTPAGRSAETANAAGESRSSPWSRIVQGALTLLLLVVIFGVVLPGLVDWGDVADALKEVDAGEALLFAALFVLIEVLKGAEQAVAIEPLPVGRAIVASEA